ncbi:MAG: type II toxin-antitoxin system Rv0910 family toxin [Mycobacteriaceae bacterium]
MAKLKVAVDVPLSPEVAWEKASDLSTFDQWLSIHHDWRGELPDILHEGVEISSVVSVKGALNRVKWTITKYEPPKQVLLKGDGKGGIKIGLTLAVRPKGNGSEVELDLNLGGAPMFGPIGAGVARALKGDITNSLNAFVNLYAA